MNISGPKLLLHAEGLMVLAASCVAYSKFGASWSYFAVMFFAPDLSMTGYLAGKKIGAWTYNAAHSYVGPILLAVFAWSPSHMWLLSFSLVWAAHIGFDRLLGYGLKYASGFKDTHLNRV